VIDKHFDILVSEGGTENKLQGPAYRFIHKPHMKIIIRAIIEGYNGHFTTRRKYRYHGMRCMKLKEGHMWPMKTTA